MSVPSHVEELATGDGRPLPRHVKRELDRLEFVMRQIKEVERADAMLEPTTDGLVESVSAPLLQLRGIGPELAGELYSEAFFRSFSNWRQIACCAGLVPSPWQSGSLDREQGVSKTGNQRLRVTMIQVA